MTLAKAPLALDGVTTPSSMVRKGMFAAVAGQAGVVKGGNSLRVSQTSPAGPGLLVAAGTGLVLNGYQSTPNEVYVVSNPSVHTVQQSEMPSASAQAAYWLVCLVVGDPGFTQNGHPFMPADFDPAQLNTFQFNRIVLLPCSSTTTTFEQLGKSYPGLALARLAIPANTTTITDAMLTDLRTMPGRINVDNNQPNLGIARGNIVATTDAAGWVSYNFTNPFPPGVIPLVMAVGGNEELVYVDPGRITNTGFWARFRFNNAAIISSGPVRIYYMAA